MGGHKTVLIWTDLQGAYSFASHRPLLVLHIIYGSSGLIVCATCMPGDGVQAVSQAAWQWFLHACNQQTLAVHKWLHACLAMLACRVLAGISILQPSIKAKHKIVAKHRSLAKHAWPTCWWGHGQHLQGRAAASKHCSPPGAAAVLPGCKERQLPRQASPDPQHARPGKGHSSSQHSKLRQAHACDPP